MSTTTTTKTQEDPQKMMNGEERQEQQRQEERENHHPNIALIMRSKPGVIDPEIYDENVVFHYYNPNLPDLQGDYEGLDRVRHFFHRIMSLSKGTFKVHPIMMLPAGDELVIMHTKNTLTLEDRGCIETNVALVWRIINGKITEVWDIPSVEAGVTVVPAMKEK